MVSLMQGVVRHWGKKLVIVQFRRMPTDPQVHLLHHQCQLSWYLKRFRPNRRSFRPMRSIKCRSISDIWRFLSILGHFDHLGQVGHRDWEPHWRGSCAQVRLGGGLSHGQAVAMAEDQAQDLFAVWWATLVELRQGKDGCDETAYRDTRMNSTSYVSLHAKTKWGVPVCQPLRLPVCSNRRSQRTEPEKIETQTIETKDDWDQDYWGPDDWAFFFETWDIWDSRQLRFRFPGELKPGVMIETSVWVTIWDKCKRGSISRICTRACLCVLLVSSGQSFSYLI